jgi:16S rRNA (cytidine1402-2'-O)-methyltransferase
MSEESLYLIPCHLGENDTYKVTVPWVMDLVPLINNYIVEDLRTARRYLRKVDPQKNIDGCTFHELNKHTKASDINGFLEAAKQGKPIGLLSEAGCPGIADPGAEVVTLAHQRLITVVPIPGPSSILLTLIGSGFNGQNFTFNGYLPREQNQRIKAVKELESRVFKNRQTQLFMETPFRAQHMLNDILAQCSPKTRLCLGVDLTLETEMVQTKTVELWAKNPPQLHKRLCIFAFG